MTGHYPDHIRRHRTLAIKSDDVRPLRDVERDYILAVLARNQGNKTVTAQQLGIGLATLRRKLKTYARTDPLVDSAVAAS